MNPQPLEMAKNRMKKPRYGLHFKNKKTDIPSPEKKIIHSKFCLYTITVRFLLVLQISCTVSRSTLSDLWKEVKALLE